METITEAETPAGRTYKAVILPVTKSEANKIRENLPNSFETDYSKTVGVNIGLLQYTSELQHTPKTKLTAYVVTPDPRFDIVKPGLSRGARCTIIPITYSRFIHDASYVKRVEKNIEIAKKINPDSPILYSIGLSEIEEQNVNHHMEEVAKKVQKLEGTHRTSIIPGDSLQNAVYTGLEIFAENASELYQD